MTREVIVDPKVKLSQLCDREELVVAAADMPDGRTWVVICTPPADAGEVKVFG